MVIIMTNAEALDFYLILLKGTGIKCLATTVNFHRWFQLLIGLSVSKFLMLEKMRSDSKLGS